jgi:hypothetical protein
MHIVTVNIFATHAAAAEGSFRRPGCQNMDFVGLRKTDAHVRPIGERDGELPGSLTLDCPL